VTKINLEVDKFAKMNKVRLLSIIIPVYNEMPNLETNLKKIINYKLKVPSEYIIVESNSTDGSRDIVKALGYKDNVKLVFQEIPLGKGNAIIEALKYCSGDIISIFDSDNEYEISDLDYLIDPLVEGKTSFVLGSRHFSGVWKFREFKNQKFLSLVFNIAHQFFCFYFYLLFGVKFNDPFTMHKIFRKEIFQGINLESKRFEIDWEILGLSIRLGSIPIELPARYLSRSFKEGKKVLLLTDPIRWLLFGVKFRMRNI